MEDKSPLMRSHRFTPSLDLFPDNLNRSSLISEENTNRQFNPE